MRTKDITHDSDIYPRIQVSQKTIENYTEALKAGAKFPPILVQRISKDSREETIILDGLHRLEAHKKAEVDDIDTTHWQEKTLDKEQWLEKLRIVSLRHNLTHGDRASARDIEFQSLRIVKARPMDKLVGIVKELASEFGKTEGYMSQLIGAEVNRRRQSRDALAYRLHLLGWTQEEVGKIIGVDQRTVSVITNNFDIKLFSKEYQSGLTPEQIASNHNLDEALVWAILLESKDDLERLREFGTEDYGNRQPRMSDYWHFNMKDPRIGQDYPGFLWGQEALNIIYRFSQPNELVVDPMAGGGVTIDCCLVMNRKCRAFDIDPTKSSRKDIIQNDITKNIPDRTNGCSLVILDPPYYKKKEQEYNSTEASKDKLTFLTYIKEIASNCFTMLKPTGCLALIYSQYIDYEDENESVLGQDVIRLFTEVGFRNILEIQTPLSLDTQWRATAVEKAKEYIPWRILPVSRSWHIFRKP